ASGVLHAGSVRTQGWSCSIKHVIARLLGALFNSTNVAEIDGAIVGVADDDIADFLGRMQKAPGLNQKFAIATGEAAGLRLPICLLEQRNNARRRDVERRHTPFIEGHSNLTALTAD